MSIANWSHRALRSRYLVAALLLVAFVACEPGESRSHHVGRRETLRLDGSWTLSMRLERPMSLSRTPRALPFTVHGSVMMMPNDADEVAFGSIAEPTQIGVYALRLDSLGLASWQRGDVPTVAAREFTSRGSSVASRDSVLIVLNPATSTRVIRLDGMLVGDDVVRGAWTAESPLGGGGTFEMTRVRMSAAPPSNARL